VAPPNVELTNEDKSLYERWIQWNYEKFWEKNGKCPTKAEVVVIDDPQCKFHSVFGMSVADF
jgi:alpha,alpha-trehalose phosphorylase (configuration-retaining)